MFGNAIEISSLFATLELADRATPALRTFDSALDRTAQNLQNIGGSLQRFGGQLTAFAAPITAGFTVAARSALSFDAAMTNAGAVLGKTATEMAGVTNQILEMGEAATAGPQAVANSYYDIVSGVQDATTHMAILDQAIRVSEAGQAELTGTTAALISVMNAYGYSQEQAAYVGDVLTRTVGVGVGTMNEFAAALPAVTGLAAQLGIEFANVGAMTAFLTTKGFSAAQATDYLRGSMIALINPNKSMTAALEALGVSSGSAAIETWGLAGTYQRLAEIMSLDELSNAVGRVEALQAVMSITGDTFNDVAANFQRGIEGATDAARAIQQESPAYQFQLLQAKIQHTAITIGRVLLPALVRLFDRLEPILNQITQWVSQNPELVLAIAGLAAAATVAGPALMGIGTALSLVGTVLGIPILLPLAAAAGAVLLLADALNIDLLGGLRWVGEQLGVFVGRFQEFGGDIGRTLRSMWNTDEDGSSFLSGLLEAFGMGRDEAQRIADQIITTVNTLVFQVQYDLGRLWDGIRPAWETVRDWFTGELVPALSNTFNNHIKPLIDNLGTLFGNLWATIGPHLERLYEWFVNKALPVILSFITDKVIPQFNKFFDLIGSVWSIIGPPLTKMTDWFLNKGLPDIMAKVQAAIELFRQFSELIGQPFETTRTPMASGPTLQAPDPLTAWQPKMLVGGSSVLGGSGSPMINAGTAFDGGKPTPSKGGMQIGSLTVHWSSAGGKDDFEQFVANLEKLAAGA